MRSAALAVSIALTLLSLATVARADDCVGRTVEHVRAEGAPDAVEVTWSAADDQWQLRDGARSRPLTAIPEHAHLKVFVARDGRVAVVRTSAGHDLDDRVLIYDRRARLVARHGLEALFGTDPRPVLERSISHMQWFRDGRFVATHTVEIELQNGRRVPVDLAP